MKQKLSSLNFYFYHFIHNFGLFERLTYVRSFDFLFGGFIAISLFELKERILLSELFLKQTASNNEDLTVLMDMIFLTY
jgi:hypothetical protein